MSMVNVNETFQGKLAQCQNCSFANANNLYFCMRCSARITAAQTTLNAENDGCDDAVAQKETMDFSENNGVCDVETKSEGEPHAAFERTDAETNTVEEKAEGTVAASTGVAAFARTDEKDEHTQGASQPEEENALETTTRTEQELALAEGLPEWSLEPPMVVVRRKRK